MPESRYKYLYERLGDHNFQLLISALLTGRFNDYILLPLRQADGGRDGVQRASDSSLVYQVKWSVSGKEKDPVEWLDSTVRSEAKNLRRLASEGARRYVLATNVPSAGRTGTGTFDVISARLDEHAKEYGFEQMSCLWREAIDGMVDAADDSLLWKFADMLAGWELVRYLIAGNEIAPQDGGLRELIRKIASAQWEDDERVKFSQVDVDREKVVDLFVDVHADHLQERGPDQDGSGGTFQRPLGGAAEILLDGGLGLRPCKLVRGAPARESPHCHSCEILP